MNELKLTDVSGSKDKLVVIDALLPDHLVELYARCVGFKVRTKIDRLERPSFSVRQSMLKVP
jgi:hypothetical protein